MRSISGMGWRAFVRSSGLAGGVLCTVALGAPQTTTCLPEVSYKLGVVQQPLSTFFGSAVATDGSSAAVSAASDYATNGTTGRRRSSACSFTGSRI